LVEIGLRAMVEMMPKKGGRGGSANKKPMSEPEMRAFARKAMKDIVDLWRAEGLSDAEIEKTIGRPLPRELRR
jgi:hypothetical protein